MNGVLNKIQFQHNKAQLQHLDNDVCDDDVSSPSYLNLHYDHIKTDILLLFAMLILKSADR